MPIAKLFLSGIRADGRHGARPGEKDEPQPFVVDLDLDVDVAADDIDATADYRGISETVRAVIERGSYDLIEVMARDVACRGVVARSRDARDGGRPQAQRRDAPRHRRGRRRGHPGGMSGVRSRLPGPGFQPR